MIRVAYELTALGLDHGGTARAIEQTLPLLENDPRIEIVRLSHSRRSGRLLRGLDRELRYFPAQLPKRVEQLGVDVLHCPSPLAPPRSAVPTLVTVHDAIAWDHPEWLTRANVAQVTRRLPKAVASGADVITSSEYSRGRLAECLDLDTSRIHVVPLGVDRRFRSGDAGTGSERLGALGITEPFLFTVGTLQPRKNLETALAAFEMLAGDHDQLHFVIAGARGWRDDQLFARIERSPYASRVQALGRVSEDELIALYRGAKVFVYPSRYEGFGFPPLEAMACGTPVASTTVTSLAEAVGDAAAELDPDSAEQMAAVIDSLLRSESLRADHSRRGIDQARKFNWAGTAEQTAELYMRAAA